SAAPWTIALRFWAASESSKSIIGVPPSNRCWLSNDCHAFEARKASGVAKPELDGVVANVAVTAEDLHGIVGNLQRHVRSVLLREVRLTGGVLCAVDLPRSFPDEQPGGVDLDRHLGEHERDRLLLSDREAEGLPLLRVVTC